MEAEKEEEKEEVKKASFVPKEETVEEKRRLRELFERKLEDATMDPSKREEMLNDLKKDLDNSFDAVKNSNELQSKPVSLYQLFLFTGKLYQTKKNYNYKLTQEEEFLLSNYLNSRNQLEEINHQK